MSQTYTAKKKNCKHTQHPDIHSLLNLVKEKVLITFCGIPKLIWQLFSALCPGVVVPCSLVGAYQQPGGTCYLHHEG
jgi:hypothetical protein